MRSHHFRSEAYSFVKLFKRTVYHIGISAKNRSQKSRCSLSLGMPVGVSNILPSEIIKKIALTVVMGKVISSIFVLDFILRMAGNF